ncbi:MAG TPA: hydrogenase nickel incorporation protein HypB [Burkholderiales bacterium]|nr:hydrogenase nickel incorporation protein HypB [Burkholderiales bacterium]
MCNACGCNTAPSERSLAYRPLAGETREVSVLKGLLDRNDAVAAHNRAHCDAHGVLALDLMSAPGAGKTALLEATIDALRGEVRMAVIEGDLETENDARRIRAKGVPAVQITTGGACHLDAQMVHEALHALSLDGVDILFIENVGNLVCPAGFDLGQHRDVALLSVTEGDDKPAKYPVLFKGADLVVLSKADLLPHVGDFEPSRAERCVRELANPAPLLTLSARSGAGMQAWLDWLRNELGAQRARSASVRPNLQTAGGSALAALPSGAGRGSAFGTTAEPPSPLVGEGWGEG